MIGDTNFLPAATTYSSGWPAACIAEVSAGDCQFPGAICKPARRTLQVLRRIPVLRAGVPVWPAAQIGRWQALALYPAPDQAIPGSQSRDGLVNLKFTPVPAGELATWIDATEERALQ